MALTGCTSATYVPDMEPPEHAELEDVKEAVWWSALGAFGGFFLAALLGVSVIATGLGGSTSGAAGADGVTLLTGERIYTSQCARCHGPEGQGGVGLPLGNGAVLERYPDINTQTRIIRRGRRAMPSFANTLSPEQIEAVAVYEREQLGR